jgi:uncharacterized membrane protein YeaQ/YmgE (transglycosylase-associated protein family)
VGIIGGFIGYWVLGQFGTSLGSGIIPQILTGALGAIILLAIVNLFTRGRV